MTILAMSPTPKVWAGLFLSLVALPATVVSRVAQLKKRIFKLTLQGEFDRALRMDRSYRWIPGYGSPLEGSILFSAGRYPEAREFLRPRAFDAKGNARLQSRELYLYALALTNDAREAEAQTILEAAIRVPQSTKSLHVALATCLLSQEKDPERARQLLEEAMNSDREPAQTYEQRADDIRRVARYAWALASCGRRSEAEARINEALAGSTGFKNRDLGGVQYYVGEAWRVLGESRKAKEAFDQALSLSPQGAVATSTNRALAKLRTAR